MKRTVIIFISLLFILSACGGKESKDNKENTSASTIAESEVAAFVGEGQMTVLRTLINSNAFFVNDVYVASHLPVDKSAAVNNANGTFAPVISDKIKTYSDLSDMLKATYTAQTAEKILSEQKYLEIDGKLFFNMKYDTESDNKLDWSNFDFKVMSVTDEKIVLDISVKDSKGKAVTLTATAVNENGNLRLDGLFC
ncbi:MAG: hypothetical protein ACI4JG_07750 [Acutalibacteraceae bacterium]